MDDKAQVSFEYLLSVLFTVLIVVVATTLALNLNQIAIQAKTKIFEKRDAIASLLLGD